MLDVMVPKVALTLSGALAALAGGALAADALGARADRRLARLRGPLALLTATLPLGALLCFPRLGLSPAALALGALGPVGAALSARPGALGRAGGLLAAFGPAATLGLLADGAAGSALLAGLHGGLGATFVGALLLSLGAPAGARRAAALGLAALLSGALRARAVGAVDPARISAMGAQWEDAAGAPLRLGALPRELDQKNAPEGVHIPKALSLLALWDPDGALPGAASTPLEQRAPVAFAALAAPLMALSGALAAGLAALSAAAPAAARLGLRAALGLGLLAQLVGLLLSDLGRGGLLLRPDLTYGGASYPLASLPGALWAAAALGLAAVALRRAATAR